MTEKILAILSATVAGTVSRLDVGRMLGAPTRTRFSEAGGDPYLCWVYAVPGARLEEFVVTFDDCGIVCGFAVCVNGSASQWTDTLDEWANMAGGSNVEH